MLGDMYGHYEPLLRELPHTVTDRDLIDERFLIQRDGRLEIYYAPTDWLRPQARIAIVGITPGKDTMRIAYQTVVDGIAAGRPLPAVLDDVKRRAAFSGFRGQLVAWLAALDVHRHLGINSAADLWEHGAELLQPTSAIRYPAFVAGKNYSGRNPDLVKHPLLRAYLYQTLAPELALIPNALVVPLGEKVAEALQLLGTDGLIDLDRCLIGFPHPSGQNGHRMRNWTENQGALKQRTAAWFAAHPVAPSALRAQHS